MRTSNFLLAAAAIAAVAAVPTHATGILIGYGAFTRTTDLAPFSGPLENGVDAQNVFGGIGSGLAWAGGQTFLATPDRGPNATVYAAGTRVDNTTSFIERFETVHLGLGTGSGSIPFTVKPTLRATTLLNSATALNYGAAGGGLPAGNAVNAGAPAGLNYFTGRSDNFAPGSSQNQDNARLDAEGIRVSADGKSVFVSDEYGPYLYQFDRATGTRIRTYTLPGFDNPSLPGNLYVPKVSSNGADEDKGGALGNTTGRVQNKGMEGLAITPDGKTLIGAIQAPTLQDGKKSGLLRFVSIDIASGATKEYGYRLTTGSGVSEIVALNDHQFLVDERDGVGQGGDPGTGIKNFYLIDLTGATDITNLDAGHAPVVTKTLVTDFAALLTANGLTVPSKIEGLAFGEDVDYAGTLYHTLWVANDNDFTPANSGLSQFFVVGYTDADLRALGASFTPQQIATPEAATAALLIPAMALAALARRRKQG